MIAKNHPKLRDAIYGRSQISRAMIIIRSAAARKSAVERVLGSMKITQVKLLHLFKPLLRIFRGPL